MAVELRWDGKYDESGRKRAPLKINLPFQTVETVNESIQERQRSLLSSGASDAEWRNRLIWGDKRYVLPSLLAEFAGKINLIYIDPPFATGANFNFTYEIEVEGEQFTKQPSMIEEKAYRDTWGKGLDSYLQWFYETVTVLRELLHENGSIYVHLDYNVVHYAKAVLDEVFGVDNFINQLVWQRTNAHNMNAKYFSRIHDTILFYAKTNSFIWNPQFVELSPEQLKRYKPDEKGRLHTGQDLTVSSTSKTRNFEWRGSRPPVNRAWASSVEDLEKLWAEGRILTKQDGTPRLDGYKVFLDDSKGKRTTDLWLDVTRVGNTSDERLNYPTQKPESLLERIINASSNENDLVLDCFCGSGTTAAVAEKLNRRWITCDLGRFAIHTARKRLLSISGVKPFVVQNLGKYERQAWQKQSFGEDAGQKVDAYVQFILRLYNAEPLHGFAWLHGLKSGKVVHIGAVDSPVTAADVRAIILEYRKNFGAVTGANNNTIDVLGWDFALEMNESVVQQAAEAGVKIKPVRIPREVLESKAVEQGDIHFYELAALFVETAVKKKTLTVALKNFIAPRDYVPKEIEERIGAERWDAWIDYWAIDFDFKGDAFHNQWQSYRTRKNKKLELATTHVYEQPGVYQLQIKVIDILGNDTTKTVEVIVE